MEDYRNKNWPTYIKLKGIRKVLPGKRLLPWGKWIGNRLLVASWLVSIGACTFKEGNTFEAEKKMVTQRDQYRTGRLTSRPKSTSTKTEFTKGLQPLGLDKRKDGLVYVPEKYSPDEPAALAVMLHGAGGIAEHGMFLLREYADKNNIILLAPPSRAGTWDIISNRYFGTDVLFLDQALNLIFECYAIDPKHLAIGGFSDGASYALCIGLTNGDLFSHILAFSPGFAFTQEPTGKPWVFISHGVNDPVLPIAPCSRRIVPQLQDQGLQVNYHEFNGRHEVPPNISRIAVEWYLQNSPR
ncbi:MAG: alpha/beta hydrolase-fold protein [Bacteroidota bacterium]|nr:alpha/beta hydrolase-fold protein [Bacteroidota bacterium]